MMTTMPAYAVHALDREHHDLHEPEQYRSQRTAERQLFRHALAHQDQVSELMISEGMICDGQACAPLAYHYYDLVYDHGRPKLVEVRTASPANVAADWAAKGLMTLCAAVLLVASLGWLLTW